MKQDDIDSIIEACIRYPSGDNLQPWRFKKNNDNKVEIFRIATDHYLQEKNYFARLEFGCLKTYLAISAKQYGYNLSYEMFSENFSIKNKQVIWAIVHFEATSDKGHHLFHFLDKRVTDRRSYLKSDSNYINEDQQIKIISNDDKKLLKAISKVESLGWSNDYYSKDILQYCNLSRSENEKETGMAWRSLGISLPERLLLYSLKTIPWLSKLVRSTFFPFFFILRKI